jgi:Domain of unknown function (DUF4118)
VNWHQRYVLPAVGALAPLGVAAALLPARDHIGNVNVALILVVVVVAIAAWGDRLAAFVSAASAAVWFDFFHTRPYYSFTITHRNDAITTGLLLVVGVAVGELAVWSRKQQAAATAGAEDVARIHAVAEMVSQGEPVEQVILAVANELRVLLSLRDCRFDVALSDRHPARIERNGDVILANRRWGVDGMGLPGQEVELLVQYEARTYGRYVLVPTPGRPVSFERRVVAVALADQVGAALAERPPTLGNGGRRFTPTPPSSQ